MHCVEVMANTIGLYRTLLGDSYSSLHPHLRRAHEAPLSAAGVAKVRGAANLIACILARRMRLPRAGDSVTVRLEVTETPRGTEWSRFFGLDATKTVQTVKSGRMVESSGQATITFDVRVSEGSVLYSSVGASLYGISLPRALAPRAKGVVSATVDGWLVDVEIASPLFGLLCAYRAELKCT